MTVQSKTQQGGFGDAPVGLALRVLLLIGMALSGWQVLKWAQALDLAIPRNGVTGLEQALERDPNYSRAQYLLGMVRRDIPGFEDLDTSLQHFAQAVGLNPYSWRYRQEQSRVLELAGSIAKAEDALVEAIRLNPRSGAYRWRLANFHLRQGSQHDAVREIGAAISLDPSLQPPALSMLLKLGLDLASIDEIWPTDRMARLRLLRGLCSLSVAPSFDVGTGSAAADGLWTDLLAVEPPISMNDGRFFPQFLLTIDQPAAAREAWIDLASRNGLLDSKFNSGQNSIWNGDFELPLQGRPLGWVLGRSEHFKANPVHVEGVDSGTVLRIEFLGTENLNFAGLSQDFVIEPGTKYQLTGHLRTEEISTDEGLFLEVVGKTSHRVLLSTDPVRGTEDWREESGTLEVGGKLEVLVIRLRRRPSRMLDGKIRGKIWLDKVSLEPVGP